MIKSILGSLLITITFSIVFSQEKTIDENEFTEIINKTEKYLEGKTYRLTKTKESFGDRELKPEIIEISLKEIVPPNKWRTVEEYKSSSKHTKTEMIRDGQNLYKRDNDGVWTKLLGSGSGGGSFGTGRITKTYRFLEKTLLNQQNVNVYEAEVNRIANKFTQTSMYQVHYIDKTKYWIKDDGGILKKVKESEIKDSKQLIRDTWIYEYDSNIKIETPIIEN